MEAKSSLVQSLQASPKFRASSAGIAALERGDSMQTLVRVTHTGDALAAAVKASAQFQGDSAPVGGIPAGWRIVPSLLGGQLFSVRLSAAQIAEALGWDFVASVQEDTPISADKSG